jgi:2-succinyl-6-hydroxy-2,4-cyclohexadiene-1-carboxylate synthase
MTKATADIVFVHGFLGLPTDWLDIQSVLRLKHRESFYSFNIWEEAHAGFSFSEIANTISQRCHQNTMVIGYSLGGRILLHLQPEILKKISAIVLISSHFGLPTNEAKQERLSADVEWSQRFLTEDWKTLMLSWEQQAVFSKDVCRPERFEKNYNRELLAKVMVETSLGSQVNKLENTQVPFEKLLYIYGLDDSKYSELAKSWKSELQQITLRGVPGGHYPLVISAVQIAEHISTFYRSMMSLQELNK